MFNPKFILIVSIGFLSLSVSAQPKAKTQPKKPVKPTAKCEAVAKKSISQLMSVNGFRTDRIKIQLLTVKEENGTAWEEYEVMTDGTSTSAKIERISNNVCIVRTLNYYTESEGEGEGY